MSQESRISRIGVVVGNLYNSQLGYCLTREFNLLRKVRPDIDCVVFTEESTPFSITPYFSVMNIAEMYDQPGLMIATSPSTAQRLTACWGANYKAFYSWDMYWARGRRRVYEPYFLLYNSNFDIIARCEEHKQLLENNFNIKVKACIENFHMQEFLSLYETGEIKV